MYRGWWPGDGESGPKPVPTPSAIETPVIASGCTVSSRGPHQTVGQEPQLEPYNAWEELEWTESTIMADIPASQSWPVGEGQALCASMGGGDQAAAASVFGSGSMAGCASGRSSAPMDQGEAAAGPSVGGGGPAGAAGGLLHAAVFLTGGWDGTDTGKCRPAWYKWGMQGRTHATSRRMHAPCMATVCCYQYSCHLSHRPIPRAAPSDGATLAPHGELGALLWIVKSPLCSPAVTSAGSLPPHGCVVPSDC